MKKKYLTLAELRRLNACSPAQEAFEEEFGKRGLLRDVIKWTRKIGEPGWEEWLLTQTLPLAKAALENGADIHVEDDGAIINVLNFDAREEDMLPFVKLFVAHGIVADADDGRALHYAVGEGWYEIAEFLMEHGAKLRGYMLKDGPLDHGENLSPLLFILHRKAYMVDVLPAGALLNVAVRRRHPEKVRLVLQHFGKDVDAEELNSQFKYAVNFSLWEVASVLKEYGARIP